MTKLEKKAARKTRRNRRAKRHAISTLIVRNLMQGKQPTKAQLDAFKRTLVDAIVEDDKK